MEEQRLTLFKKAIECGCTEVAPPMDCFWGERMGKVEDPFGFQWGISTQTEVLTAEEVQERGAEWSSEWGRADRLLELLNGKSDSHPIVCHRKDDLTTTKNTKHTKTA
jgi:hypothetical protein